MKNKLFNRITISVITTLTLSLIIIIALISVQGGIITDKGIVQTGAIRINSDQLDGINVFLNDSKKNLNNGTINGIIPGEYSIRVEKSGYNSWIQDITVRGQIITQLDVQLLPSELGESTLFLNNNVYKSWVGETENYLFYITKEHQLGSNIGIWKKPINPQNTFTILTEQETKISNINDRVNIILESENFDLIPSPNDTKVILTDGNFVYVIDTNGLNTPTSEDLITIDFPIGKIGWIDNSNLWIESNNLLIEHELDTSVNRIINYFSDDNIFSVNQSVLAYPKQNGIYTYSKNSKDELLKLENLTLPNGISKITVRDNNTFIFIENDAGKLFLLYTDESSLLEIGEYKLISIAPNNNSIIVKNENGEYKIIRIQIFLRTGDIDVQTYTPEFSDIEDQLIKWSPNSSRIYVIPSSSKSKIYSVDNRGSNFIDLLETNTEINEFIANNDSLIVPFEDELNGYNQLYEYSLEQSN